MSAFAICRHYKVNGSWTDTGDNDGIPYVTELQASNDSPPPPDDSVLVLTNLTEEDSGPYSCAVKNQYGGDLGSGWLTVSRADVAVKRLKGCTSCHLKCMMIYIQFGSIVAYLYRYSRLLSSRVHFHLNFLLLLEKIQVKRI